MDATFDASTYIKGVGDDLVRAFERARRATTPGLVAAAMEKAARDQLTQVLPRGLAVGSGCVIDTDGGTSRQMDIVLYERDICPVFSINGNPETTYYPCVGVVAVGEVKSTIGKGELTDSFAKIASVKTLRRVFTVPVPEHGKKLLYRRYGELSPPSVIERDPNFDPACDDRGHIVGFILGGSMAASKDTIFNHYIGLIRDGERAHCPNLAVFLEGGAFLMKDAHPGKPPLPAMSALNANSVGYYDYGVRSFSTLIRALFLAYRCGLTGHALVFDHYLQVKPDASDSSWADTYRLEFISGREDLADHLMSVLQAQPPSE